MNCIYYIYIYNEYIIILKRKEWMMSINEFGMVNRKSKVDKREKKVTKGKL